MTFLSAFTWGVDGFGRQFLVRRSDDRTIIFCMIPGWHAWCGVELLEKQDEEDKAK